MYIIQSSKVAPESTISAHLMDAILLSVPLTGQLNCMSSSNEIYLRKIRIRE